VEHVDKCIVIVDPTRPHTDLLDVARSVCGAKLHVVGHVWQDFATGRNRALDAAADIGADWAITIDADEWWERAELFPRALPTLAATCSHVIVESGWNIDVPPGALHPESWHLWQPRAIRPTAPLRWFGRAHEILRDASGSWGPLSGAKLPGARWCSELPTPESRRAKAERDLPLLEQEIEDDPTVARWHMFRGWALALVARYDDALVPLETAITLSEGDPANDYCAARSVQILTDIRAALGG
jgi:glycosyltransferase involved in cell wall biosynthesis